MLNWRLHASYAPVVCGLLLFGGLVVDLNTNQELVVSIIYAIPIAISGVLASRNLTWWCIGLALLANVAAGYGNASTFGGVDSITILNRGLAGLSFLLVGMMTLLLESTSEEVEHLADAEEHVDREHRLREFMIELSGPMEPEELMDRAVTSLRTLLGADAVVATGLVEDRFAEPRWADPPGADLAATGTLASWAVDALPITTTPVIAVRSDQGMMSVGRWRCGSAQDLVVLAARPDRRRAAALLGEALAVLDPIRERSLELQRARAASGAVVSGPAEDGHGTVPASDDGASSDDSLADDAPSDDTTSDDTTSDGASVGAAAVAPSDDESGRHRPLHRPGPSEARLSSPDEARAVARESGGQGPGRSESGVDARS